MNSSLVAVDKVKLVLVALDEIELVLMAVDEDDVLIVGFIGLATLVLP